MDVERSAAADDAASTIAAAIGEPARARMLYCLLDDRARTSTELAMVADVSPSTASVHLHRLKAEGLVKVLVQGRHRYYSLAGADVAAVLEGLSVLAGRSHHTFAPSTPNRLRAARTCYDHIAGAFGVTLHDRLIALGWLVPGFPARDNAYDVTPKGIKSLEALGVDVDAAHTSRRRFAFACLDWSERRSHLGGGLGAALLELTLRKKWLTRERGGRGLQVTALGRRDMQAHFGIRVS